jgi:hypothetical protein
MNASPYASEAKITEACAAIGADFIGQTEQTLLQQLVVAAATSTGSNIETTTGGNGSADSGKVPLINTTGGLSLGGPAGAGNVLEVVSSTASFAIEATTSTSGGIAIHATPNGADTSAFGTHLTTGAQIGFQIDGSLGTSTSTGVFAYMSGPILIAADDNFAEQVSIWAGGRKIRFTASDARAAAHIDLTSATPTGSRTITLPNASGTVVLVNAGVINVSGIPTSASGLSSGDIWSNAGVLNVVP